MKCHEQAPKQMTLGFNGYLVIPLMKYHFEMTVDSK